MSQQKQITQTLYFVKWNSDEHIELSNTDSALGGARVVLGSTEVTVDIPDTLRDPTEAKLECLTMERERLNAETGAKIANIDEQIQKLKAISYQESE